MNTQEAKANFLQLVNAASAGEEVIIENEGIPTVRIVPYATPQSAPEDTSTPAYSLQAS
ncbi:MAG: type II toxin-antitoxin system prevent-host-death family antitoxin [Coriobacteriales bacterium]|nr:type II toxin-antitoxin system prevent-host-death family antitoxin [Coriobacteriales bacterium]